MIFRRWVSGCCVDDGQPFHNPVREELPTTRSESVDVMPNAGSSTHFMPRLPMVGPLLP